MEEATTKMGNPMHIAPMGRYKKIAIARTTPKKMQLKARHVLIRSNMAIAALKTSTIIMADY